MKRVLAGILPAERVTASAAACARVAALPEFVAAKTVALYAPLPSELDVFPLADVAIRAGKAVVVPRTNWATRELVFSPLATTDPNSLVLGRLGLREPAPHAPTVAILSIDLLIVPGLAFDRGGRRLGRGAGFYDRLLANRELRALIVGIGFDEQMADEVPVDPHDRAMARVVTPGGVISIGA